MILDMMMVQGLQPTIHAITQLIVLAPNRGKASSIFRDFVSEDLRIPDNVMLNALISKCTSFEEGIGDLNLLDSYQVRPDNYTINTLLTLIGTSKELVDLGQIAASHAILPDLVYYRILINKSDSVREAAQILDAMLAQGLRPDTRVLNECLNKARNQEEAGVILDRFSDFKHCASHDIITKNVLMKLSETLCMPKAY